MTFSNRIPLAGAIPVLVVLALAAMVAVIALGAPQRASAAADNKTCDISPVILDMLLDRYGMNANDCDTLDLDGTVTPALELNTDDHAADTWDFSGQGLTSFEITEDDKDALVALSTGGSVANPDAVEDGVNYIDLTGNPLTIDDVSLANIPSRVALKISADSNVAGFQVDESTITEGSAGYVGVAIPGQRAKDEDDMDVQQTVFLKVTVTGGDIAKPLNAAIAADVTGSTVIGLVDFGTSDDASATRELEVNSENENVIFYFPIKANKDNTNEEEWGFSLEIDETVRDDVIGGSGTDADDRSAAAILENLTAGGELDFDEIEINVLDADAPVNGDNERSEDVVAAIVDEVDGTDGEGAGIADELYGGHIDFDDLTLRDLGAIENLTVVDTDGDDEPLESLLAGDFEGLSGLDTLRLVGAGTLPSGIFAGVGGHKNNTAVEITFAANETNDDDIEKVGNYKPSTLPAHIFADQEKKQVIVLTDDTNDKNKGTTSGLDAGLYGAAEEGHFFVMTNAATTWYALGNKVVFGDPAADAEDDILAFATPDITDRGGGVKSESSKVVRFAVPVPEDDPDKDGGRTDWLFLFGAPNGNVADADPAQSTDASALIDIAVVEITEDD